MKFVRFGPAGAEKPGIIDAEGRLRDLSEEMDDLSGIVLTHLDDFSPEGMPVVGGNPRLGVPVAGVGKFIGIGLNYSDHAAEARMDIPAEPIVFMKATSSLSGPHDPIRLPRGSVKTDWEVELGVVIGKPAKYVSAEEALDHVAGYMVVNDVSERAFQIERGGQWTKGKSCDSFGPCGPWLVTPDEAGEITALDLSLSVNGSRMQQGSAANMIFSVARIISYLSQMMTLHPGDIIATGTPAGVGMGMVPPRFLKPGDVVELSISGLGTQRQEVVSD
ncbi:MULTISPECIES: fumarylacetoacetate hydrolase family protein [Actibacterium]|uniref:2-keto-4-pentenoate hydratase/2-oxohepta-3-ene-1,7-dioic acid hydratase in catechol pathway n=1 Tax=Actibacterium naphthalenivorans TaxID=1614693 RepID=A0A840CIT6_9RHOB|nr:MULTISPECIES: fumarylacetoacetate hydrolase family protein [Actibacterium]ALG90980.1 2-hydroxyhepta-2,4-diene-1,7-dioate isomerase [Actibacterium sp. EMB200-NS6]MBB4023358.1 2-keto-4-pentenoate hydratase/2-oxohepta-3-ene-1,7-dioic acid hydratase in catechol pathway [Actibacterium naphthalenivorans]